MSPMHAVLLFSALAAQTQSPATPPGVVVAVEAPGGVLARRLEAELLLLGVQPQMVPVADTPTGRTALQALMAQHAVGMAVVFRPSRQLAEVGVCTDAAVCHYHVVAESPQQQDTLIRRTVELLRALKGPAWRTVAPPPPLPPPPVSEPPTPVAAAVRPEATPRKQAVRVGPARHTKGAFRRMVALLGADVHAGTAARLLPGAPVAALVVLEGGACVGVLCARAYAAAPVWPWLLSVPEGRIWGWTFAMGGLVGVQARTAAVSPFLGVGLQTTAWLTRGEARTPYRSQWSAVAGVGPLVRSEVRLGGRWPVGLTLVTQAALTLPPQGVRAGGRIAVPAVPAPDLMLGIVGRLGP